MKYNYTIDKLKEAVQNSYSLRNVCILLGIVPAGGNYKTLKSRLIDVGISTDHFTGKVWNKGKKIDRPATKLEEVIVNNRQYPSHKLKIRLIKEGYKKAVCECCGNAEWLGQPIKLELHHINGINDDNRLENLQLLCPNCHAYTDNYRGKNKSAHSEKSEVEQPKFEEALTDNADGNLEPSLIEEGVETRQAEPKS